MIRAWEIDFGTERETWRRTLRAAGFTQDGDALRGPVSWQQCDGRRVTATIEVTLNEAFPFSPPHVRVLDPGDPLDLTFHRDRDGSLCLWRSDVPFQEAPWRDPFRLLDKVAAWLRQTMAGWPGDDDCDLERYLPSDPRFVVYDRELLAIVKGCVRTRTDAGGQRVTVTGVPQRPPSRPHRIPRQRARRRPAGLVTIGRKQRRLAWVTDIGQVDRPIVDWASLCEVIGADAGEVRWLVSIGAVEFVVLRYRRADAEGVLALSVHRMPTQTASFEVRACESADTSIATRMLRAGPSASELADRRVAVVGVGAVGSFVSDLLFRHGVRQLTLIDPQLLRPGNLVRHLAGESMVGYPKVSAVKIRLGGLGFDISGVDDRHETLATPDQALRLLREHHLVVDATANERATALLAWATRHIARPVVSVCVQRHGAIARVDRFPLRRGERHHDPLSTPAGLDLGREHGCDEPVSPTPPAAVVAAAQLACRVSLDELALDRTLPPTLVEVLVPCEVPYDVPGLQPHASVDLLAASGRDS